MEFDNLCPKCVIEFIENRPNEELDGDEPYDLRNVEIIKSYCPEHFSVHNRIGMLEEDINKAIQLTQKYID